MGIKTTITGILQKHILIALAGIALVLICMAGQKRTFRDVPVTLFLFSLYICTSQLILYAKSTMLERYLIPFVTGWWFLFIIIINKYLRNFKIPYFIYMLLCGMAIFYHLRVSFYVAHAWADSGKETNIMLNSLEELIKQKPDVSIWTGTNTLEYDHSIYTWLSYYTGKEVNYTSDREDDAYSNYEVLIVPKDEDYKEFLEQYKVYNDEGLYTVMTLR